MAGQTDFLLCVRMDRLNLGKLIAAFVGSRARLEAKARFTTRNPAAAEDLVHDAWVRIQSARLDETIENPAGFVTQVVKTTTAGHMRKQRRRNEIDTEVFDLLFDETDELSPERILIAQQNLKAVQAVLDGLPEKTRQIFLMSRIGGFTHRELAQHFQITEEAIYYHIRRALECLAVLRDEIAD
jgi:RNA polymerase sigma-70 factor (ECF subfamily)